MWDPAGLIVYANRRLAPDVRLLPGRADTASGPRVSGAKGRGPRALLKQPGFPSQGEEHEVCLVRADGSELWAMLSLSSLFGPEGDFRGSLGLLTDLTARREVEERTELLATLNRKKADLQRLLHELIVAQEKERRHLSHELHDEIVQLLTAADSYMQGVENNLPRPVSPPPAPFLRRPEPRSVRPTPVAEGWFSS